MSQSGAAASAADENPFGTTALVVDENPFADAAANPFDAPAEDNDPFGSGNPFG